MTATSHGHYLIAGNGMAKAAWFESEPAHGPILGFSVGSPAIAGQVAEAAIGLMPSPPGRHGPHACAPSQKKSTREDAMMATSSAEIDLPLARLQGPRGRTTAQLRFFADRLQAGGHPDRRHDPALPRPNL